jgi:signal transduction histidine kinase
VSLALLLRVAEKAVAGDDRTSELLRRASEELQLVAQELRELARGIHPAILVEHGLGVALEALVGRTPIPVTLEAVQTRLPASRRMLTLALVACAYLTTLVSDSATT